MQIYSLPSYIGFALIAFSASLPADGQEHRDPTALGFVKGYTWGWDGRHGLYASPQARDSMKKMADMGCDWVCISFATTMPTYDNPQFNWSTDNPRMVSDEDIHAAVAMARDLKLKVILKPVVNCRDGVWRAWIRFYRPITAEEKAQGIEGESDPWGESPGVREGMVRDQQKWRQWWENYAGFLTHYAEIAEDEQVEMFCLGCEMSSTEDQVERWRNLIEDVRNVFHGCLTYNANHGRENELAWWDAVDVVGISGILPGTSRKGGVAGEGE